MKQILDDYGQLINVTPSTEPEKVEDQSASSESSN